MKIQRLIKLFCACHRGVNSLPLTAVLRRAVAVGVDGWRARLEEVLVEKLQEVWSLLD